MKTKLNSKLKELFEMVGTGYEEFWDTCCDHGQLGMALLEAKKVKKVYFVDRVESITQKLKKKLESIPELTNDLYEVHTMSAEKIEPVGSKSLVCISGVGGETVLNIVDGIKGECDFLISPQYYIFEVREYFKLNHFLSLEERIVFEGKFARELFLLSKRRGSEISLVGEGLLNLKDKKQLDYIQNIISHLEKNRPSNNSLELYKKLLNSL